MTDHSRRLEIGLFILILLLGSVLRLAALDSVPPGLTHDEADHSVDAARVLEGHTPIYFTVGYGREPLYDYVTALVMLVVGRTFLASRLTAALFGIALMVLTYAWVRVSTQNRWLALATMAGMAVGFWAVSTSRQALRSETLPVLYMAAALAMRRGIRLEEDPVEPTGKRPQVEIDRLWWFILAGGFLGLSIYTYLAARLMWLVFPAFFAFLALTQPGVMRKAWPGLIIMLVVAAVIAAPLVLYLIQNPAAEIRINQLSGPISSFLAGEPGPLRQNVRAALGMITIRGDDLWLYNIPGRPLLGPITSLLFYLGISIAVISIFYPYRPARRGRATFDDAFRISTTNVFMLLTLFVGLLPAMVTGIGASNTRVIGMQPALYYFPALGVTWLANWGQRQVGDGGLSAIWTAFALLIIVVTGVTVYQYFGVWANERNVRVAYHTTLVETLHYLDEHPEIGPDVALSTITPGRYHDPAAARMVLQRDDLRLRWFDGRSSLLLMDASPGYYTFPEVAPPASSLEAWLSNTVYDVIRLRPSDFNRTVEIIEQPATSVPGEIEMVAGDALGLLAVNSPPGPLHPGETFEVLTIWRILSIPNEEVVLFTHALDEQNQVSAQQDFLGAPTSSWRVDDLLFQIHTLTLPADLPIGDLRLEIGAYTLPDIERLPLTSQDGSPMGDSLIVDTVEVVSP